MKLPAGAIPLGCGKAHKIRKAVQAMARHAYDGKTLLVPGIPEANTLNEKLDALKQFSEGLKKRLS